MLKALKTHLEKKNILKYDNCQVEVLGKKKEIF